MTQATGGATSLVAKIRRHGLVGATKKTLDVITREGWRGVALRMRNADKRGSAGQSSDKRSVDGRAASESEGITLIGHPFATLGIGGHVRRSAHAFASTKIPFGLVNIYDTIDPYGDKFPEFPFAANVTRANRYPVSLFHLNADEMPQAYMHLGAGFFEGRYNIGFWLWELSKFPDAWLPSFRFFDELWAPSRFVQQAVADEASCPVIHMPLAVEAAAATILPRGHFGLPEDKFLFLFMFDFTSYVARKNPLGAYAAFRSAFGSGRRDVALVIKVNGGQQKPEEYRAFLDAIGCDASIIVIDRVMTDEEVRNLVRNCDCFVSLHRSEGFGFGLAEAMYFGKPVIATGYSGNTDFTHEDNAFLVDYTLVPVKAGEYPHDEGQLWADPDVDQAASHMRRLVENPLTGQAIGARAAEYIRAHHSFHAVGGRYRRRLATLGFASPE